jgi:ATP-dependent DNA helicase RecG
VSGLITLDILERWLAAPSENEHLEFKEAKQQYDWQKTLEYCVAMANEGGGFLVLGVADKPPRKVVGTHAFLNLNETKQKLFDKLRIRVEITELAHTGGRVLVLEIPSRPKGQPMELDGTYLARVGESVRPLSADQLKRIFAEGQTPFLDQPARAGLAADEVVALLDVQTYFDLMKLPFPSNREGILARLLTEGLVGKEADQYAITNLGAVLLAKDLRQFQTLWRKAPRVIVYKGKNKLETVRDQPGIKGYAVGFEGLIGFINSQLPANEVVGQARREEVRMYPEIAVRELVANALIHQDFDETGSSVMVEVYADRIEISNPGKPLIPRERFVDEYKSRNERLADTMRRMGICEEKSSGIDKVVHATEFYQLPPPDFRIGEHHTTTVLFAHQEFAAMNSTDRVWACYLHCCLRYVSNEKMTNQSLRERFKLPDERSAAVSRIIADAVEAKLIRNDDAERQSKRYSRYVPFWA